MFIGKRSLTKATFRSPVAVCIRHGISVLDGPNDAGRVTSVQCISIMYVTLVMVTNRHLPIYALGIHFRLTFVYCTLGLLLSISFEVHPCLFHLRLTCVNFTLDSCMSLETIPVSVSLEANYGFISLARFIVTYDVLIYLRRIITCHFIIMSYYTRILIICGV